MKKENSLVVKDPLILKYNMDYIINQFKEFRGHGWQLDRLKLKINHVMQQHYNRCL